MVPTRELAKQIANAVDDYSKYIDIKKVAIFGGISIKDQEKKLNAGVDIAVATTGRLLEHIKNNTIENKINNKIELIKIKNIKPIVNTVITIKHKNK